ARERLRDLGLADSCLALEQQGPPHRECEVDRRREPAVGEVRVRRESALDLVDRSERHPAIVGRGTARRRGRILGSRTRTSLRKELALISIALSVNGVRHEAEVEPRTLLVDFLRDDLDLTGTKIGCDTSTCGACTVHLDGLAVKACTVLAVQADGSEVTTI